MKEYISTAGTGYNTKLASLVVNPPYQFDPYSSAPKISKLLSFPFGIKLDSASFLQLLFRGLSMATAILLISSIFLTAVSLPIKGQNVNLYSDTKMLAREKFSLLFNIQETISYNKLFSISRNLAMKDSEETLYTNSIDEELKREFTFNKKSQDMQFSGF